jgi:hypothetical protein
MSNVSAPPSSEENSKLVAEPTPREIAGYKYACKQIGNILSGFRGAEKECDFIQDTLKDALATLNAKYASRMKE